MSDPWEDEGVGGEDDWEAGESLESDLEDEEVEDELEIDELEDDDELADDGDDELEQGL